ncbi:bifunctional folylpolyglutamate synthase/dihydrofolate synthase [Streptococcaceae bacterium ESL0729]|nr:bifunctional folylpolyglutamate synthase/dihydrofolate synthase [Streptococcaceae bacterium ESL0729]
MVNKKDIAAVTWIHGRKKFGSKPGTIRIEHLLKLLGNPERDLKVIHIGGTNGKGSTVSNLKSLFMGQGLKVATFTSPFIEVFNERIAINGNFISDQDLDRLTAQVIPLIEEMDKDAEVSGITEFEIITALAFMYFKEKKCDLVLLEVGLGGLYDSTNVIIPEISVITTIGLDHMDILGDTLEKIAWEKAGIIKDEVALVTGNIGQEALAVIEKIAEKKRSPHYKLGRDYKLSEGAKDLRWGENFYFSNEALLDEEFYTPLQGRHQIENTGLALEVFYLYCRKANLPFELEAVRKSLLEVKWPARMEKVSDNPLIILDGAHNIHAIDRLVDNLSKDYAHLHKKIIFSALETKDIEGMLTRLSNLEQTDLYLTTFDFPKALNLSSEAYKAYKQFPDWKLALGGVQTDLKEDDMIIITGSLYFISQIRDDFFKKN